MKYKFKFIKYNRFGIINLEKLEKCIFKKKNVYTYYVFYTIETKTNLML